MNLSKIKKDLYDNLEDQYIKEEADSKINSCIDGLLLGGVAVLDIGILTGVYGENSFSYYALGFLGVVAVSKVVAWVKKRNLKSKIEELENNYEIASKAYSAKNEEVANTVIDKEEVHKKAYI